MSQERQTERAENLICACFCRLLKVFTVGRSFLAMHLVSFLRSGCRICSALTVVIYTLRTGLLSGIYRCVQLCLLACRSQLFYFKVLLFFRRAATVAFGLLFRLGHFCCGVFLQFSKVIVRITENNHLNDFPDFCCRGVFLLFSRGDYVCCHLVLARLQYFCALESMCTYFLHSCEFCSM